MKCFVATIFLFLGCAGESVVKIPNNSMEPTIKMGSAVRIDETYYSKNSIQRFDIVVVTDPVDKESRYISIPNGEYFLLGDNRANSYDSRYWKKKTVSKDGISAKVIGFDPK